MDDNKIKLLNVRLSFPSLFNKASFQGQEGKYEATLLIDKEDKATIKLLQDEVKRILKENKVKVPKDKICIKDGDEADYDGYAGCYYAKFSTHYRPMVIDRNKATLSEKDNRPYAGCYVNALVSLWLQNNTWGKRINGNLWGIQFVKDGEPFGTGGYNAMDDFDKLEETDEEKAEKEKNKNKYDDIDDDIPF